VEEVAVLVAALLGRRGEGRSLLGQPAVNDVTQDLENFAQLAGHPATTSLEVERPEEREEVGHVRLAHALHEFLQEPLQPKASRRRRRLAAAPTSTTSMENMAVETRFATPP
jgi:hypothetical protein